MKFTFSWLKEHLDTEATAAEVGERLTMIGHELESLTDRAAGLREFIVAEIVKAEPHPNADKLRICIVNTGVKHLQVVCGAPNARDGLKGVFAATGHFIPGSGITLKPANIRGVESNGMLLSEREMGLSDEHAGIVELPADALVGAPAVHAMGLDDPLFDVAITPNRGDCLGVRGLARDLAATGIGYLKPPSVAIYRLGLLETQVFSTGLKPLAVPVMPSHYASPIHVHLEFDEETSSACPYFAGRLVRDVRNKPSPQWLRDRLSSVGLRPISSLVDVTNLMTLDLCRPLHVFDAKKLTGHLHVRLARQGERLAALNGREYELTPEMTVIADDAGAQALAGVIGGERTACDENTTEVFIESALFEPVRTAATGRALGIQSDARFRFERGIDPSFVEPGLEIATRLIIHLCGGEASDLMIAGSAPAPRTALRFRPERVRSLTGMEVTDGECDRILGMLGFDIEQGKGQWQITPPSWRNDVTGEACMIEEVVRIAGYDRIPTTSLPRPSVLPAPALTLEQRRPGTVRRVLASRGLIEAVTYSFMSSSAAEAFKATPEELRLVNPISSDLDVMRPSAVPNLIAAAGRNADRGIRDVALFEVGPAYASDRPDGQSMVAAGIRAGRSGPRHWADPSRPVDAFDAKADVLAVLEALGSPIDKLTLVLDAPAWYHPGRSGVFLLGPKAQLATFGEVHPRVLKRLGVRGPVVAFEVFIKAVPTPKSAMRGQPRLSALQPVERDFAFVVDAGVSAADILKAAKAAAPELIDDVRVFDVFAGGVVGEGRKSVAISVVLQPVDKTLTDADIEAVASQIVTEVAAATGGVLRA